MTNRDQIIFFINNFLNISSYKDNSSNGLQIIGKNDVKKIALGVSYSLEFLEKSIELNCDIMIVHHGLFWGKIDRIDNSILKERIKKVFDHDLNLAAYHLPLDGNEEIGNNVSLCNELGTQTEISSTFGSFTNSIQELVQREKPISFLITSALSEL